MHLSINNKTLLKILPKLRVYIWAVNLKFNKLFYLSCNCKIWSVCLFLFLSFTLGWVLVFCFPLFKITQICPYSFVKKVESLLLLSLLKLSVSKISPEKLTEAFAMGWSFSNNIHIQHVDENMLLMRIKSALLFFFTIQISNFQICLCNQWK